METRDRDDVERSKKSTPKMVFVADVEALIDVNSKKYSLDSDLIRAIVLVESGGNPFTVRYEPAWKYLYFAREFAEKLNITYPTEVFLQSTSWGYMQVMGSVCRELSFTDMITKLATPEIGMDYGCKKLAQVKGKYENETDIISAYNAGSPKKTAGGMYSNQKYVDRVHAQLLRFRHLV